MPAAEPEAEPGGPPAAAVTPAAEPQDLAEIAPPADLADLLGSSSLWKLQEAPQSPFEELQEHRAHSQWDELGGLTSDQQWASNGLPKPPPKLLWTTKGLCLQQGHG